MVRNHKNKQTVKKHFIVFCCASVWAAALTAQAQNTPVQTTTQSPSAQGHAAPIPTDSVLLSEAVEGDYRIERYRISKEEEADYSVRYSINNAELNRSLNGNDAELIDLKNLVTGFLNDTLNEVKRVMIMGYASPDGPLSLNRSLAQRRAENMKNYVDKQYRFSTRYAVMLDAEVPVWSSLRDKVAASPIPMRDSVLMILDSGRSEAEKQAALKQMPAVWSYLAKQILPPVRRVEVTIDYGVGSVVEHRTAIAPKPTTDKPAEEVIIVEEVEQVENPCCRELCQSEQLGIIVDMPGVEVDF